ncbi:MAG: hypothetical protein QM722_05050 [Piscinibacter sp.]
MSAAAPMCRRRSLLGWPLAAGALLAAGLPAVAAGRPGLSPAALALSVGGMAFTHRWSRDGQHEFTPAGDEDLTAWRDMLTLNLHDGVRSGESLAVLANAVLARYRDHGKVLATRSVPQTASQPAEHLIVAVLGQPKFLEAAFARLKLHDGAGVVAVRSHRVYGQAAGPEMSRWLAAEGARTEQALMTWTQLPPLSRLQNLPRS